jgi:hypothetical protein
MKRRFTINIKRERVSASGKRREKKVTLKSFKAREMLYDICDIEEMTSEVRRLVE